MQKWEPSADLASDVIVFLWPNSLSDSFSSFPVCKQVKQNEVVVVGGELEIVLETTWALFGSLEGRRKERLWGEKNIGENREIFHIFWKYFFSDKLM